MTQFKVAAVSSNTNSFGLNQFVFMSRDGEAWTGLKSKLYSREKEGDLVNLPENREVGLSRLGFECPMQIEYAPDAVVEEVFV